MMRILLIFGLFFLSACGGWHPLYQDGSNEAVSRQLGQIRLEPVYSVAGQELYGSLQDRLQKFPRQTEKYRLHVTTCQRDRILAVGTDGSATQILRYYSSQYRLESGDKNQDFHATVSFSLSQEGMPYVVATRHQEVDRQAQEALASRMIKQLALFFASHPSW